MENRVFFASWVNGWRSMAHNCVRGSVQSQEFIASLQTLCTISFWIGRTKTLSKFEIIILQENSPRNNEFIKRKLFLKYKLFAFKRNNIVINTLSRFIFCSFLSMLNALRLLCFWLMKFLNERVRLFAD